MTVKSLHNFSGRKCKSGMLESYMTYAIHQESPQDFHLWVLISMIACALGRSTFVSMGMWSTYPNMYIILVGESAITHKSTAIKMGMTPLRDALPDLPFLGDYLTAQALTSALSEIGEEQGDSIGIIEGSELSVLLDNSKKDDVFIKRITDFWDSPSHRTFRTIGRGKEELKNVCINLLGGSTPKWLRSSIPEESLEGGFFSRLILVHRPPKGEKNSRPTINAEQREALEFVKHDLAAIQQNMNGEFIVDDAAQQLFDEWYHTQNHPEKAESFMRGYYGRKGDFIQKVSMCLSASYSDDMRITYEDMSLAMKLLNENEINAKQLIGYMGTTEQGAKHAQVVNHIRRNTIMVPPDDPAPTNEELRHKTYIPVIKTGIAHSVLMRKLSYKMAKPEIDQAVLTLHEIGDIKIVRVGKAKMYQWIAEEEDDGL
jgi:hypothetical protein